MRRALILLATILLAAGAGAVGAPPSTPTGDSLKLAQKHYQTGLDLMKAEQWDQAAEEFKAATALDPHMVMAWYNLGQCRMAEKRYVEAVAAYKSTQEAYTNLGALSEKERARLARERRDEMDEIRDSLKRVDQTKYSNPEQLRIRLEDRLRMLESMEFKNAPNGQPIPAEFRLALGSAYFRQNKLAEAEAEYRAALEVNPKLGPVHNNLAVICLMTGRADEAAAELQLAEKNGVAVNPRLKADIEKARAAKP